MNKIFKWIKLIRFIKKHRNLGIASFGIVTTSDEVIIYNKDIGGGEFIKEQIRINY